MNPFDLRGPQFLVFYITLLAIISAAIYIFRNNSESNEPVKLDYSDPYLIAFLRGRGNEALRVAVVSLIDRGLLKIEGKKKQKLVAKESAKDLVRRPIEKALLEKFRHPDKPSAIFNDSKLGKVSNDYENELTQLGLLPDAAIKSERLKYFLISLCIAWGFSITKIVIALSRGRYNLGFLIALTIIFPFIAYRISNPFRTRKGDRALADSQHLFSNLKDRAKSLHAGGETNEAALLAAVFGLSMLPNEYAYAKTLYPKSTSSSGCGAAGCGSSCGSSCGGGGCGGGCGGCGG